MIFVPPQTDISWCTIPKGPVVWAPLSEEYGRKYITIVNFILFTLFTISCALAPNWKAFLVFRLLFGTFGSSVVAIAPGILADIYHDPASRGWSIAIFMAVCIMILLLSTWLTERTKGDWIWSHFRPHRIWIRVTKWCPCANTEILVETPLLGAR